MESVGEIIWISIVAGIIGTTGMTIFLFIVTKLEIAHVDMVRAVGSLFTKSIDTSNTFGLMVHYTAGIFFAFLYTTVILLLGIESVFNSLIAGLTLSFVHGFFVSFLLIVAVAEHHPLPQFRQPGIKVAVGHYAAHIVYGFLVGLVIGVMNA